MICDELIIIVDSYRQLREIGISEDIIIEYEERVERTKLYLQDSFKNIKTVSSLSHTDYSEWSKQELAVISMKIIDADDFFMETTNKIRTDSLYYQTHMSSYLKRENIVHLGKLMNIPTMPQISIDIKKMSYDEVLSKIRYPTLIYQKDIKYQFGVKPYKAFSFDEARSYCRSLKGTEKSELIVEEHIESSRINCYFYKQSPGVIICNLSSNICLPEGLMDKITRIAISSGKCTVISLLRDIEGKYYLHEVNSTPDLSIEGDFFYVMKHTNKPKFKKIEYINFIKKLF